MTPPGLTIQKLEDMLGAHNDGVYRFSARGEDFAPCLARHLLRTMQREENLREVLHKIMAEYDTTAPDHRDWCNIYSIARDALAINQHACNDYRDTNGSKPEREVK